MGRVWRTREGVTAPSDPPAPDGMGPEARAALGSALRARGGLVIVAGPSGSGRSTTVAALAAGLAARGLRVGAGPGDADPSFDFDAAVLDPLQGRAAARAATAGRETGPLVIAAVTAPDAVGAIGAMRALGVTPFRLACVLRAVVAQRLVRRLCPKCRRPVQADHATGARLGFDSGTIVHEPVGCKACAGTGFRGRTAVFEVLRVDDDLAALIDAGGDQAVIAGYAFRGADDLGAAARRAVRDGRITVAEAVRISRGGDDRQGGTAAGTAR